MLSIAVIKYIGRGLSIPYRNSRRLNILTIFLKNPEKITPQGA
jgi:hypothetical protein